MAIIEVIACRNKELNIFNEKKLSCKRNTALTTQKGMEEAESADEVYDIAGYVRNAQYQTVKP